MARPTRQPSAGTWRHVFNRGAGKQPVFLTDRDRVEFLRLLGVAHDRFGLRVHAYCLMSNHYHLLVDCPDGGLSEAMHLVGSVYVRHFNERAGRDGPLFRDRFSDHTVDSEHYLVRLVTYIHQNPLAFLTPDRLGGYRWSSLRVYTSDRRCPAWMRTEFVADLFGGLAAVAEATLGVPSTPTSGLPRDCWVQAIDVAVDECLQDGVRQSAAKTVATLLAAGRAGASSAERMALARARRRADRQPEILAAVEAARRLIAA